MLEILYHYWYLVVVSAVVGFILDGYFKRGLNRYPGPFLAKFTDFWRFYDVIKDHHEETVIDLHRKHGPVVRIGPNVVSISAQEYVPRIYGINKGYVKSRFYNALRARNKGKPATSIFAVRDEAIHTSMKKPLAGMYSLSSLTSYEPLVDSTIRTFMDRLEQEYDGGKDSGKPCNMADWLQFYAFDVILNLTFSNTIGFLEQGKDVDGFMQALDVNMNEGAPLGQMPWMIYIMRFNPIIGYFAAENSIFPGFVRRQIQEHAMKMRSVKFNGEDQAPAEGMQDFLYRFMMTRANNPDSMSESDIFVACMSNVIAGSDTTAITLRAILYYVLRNPESRKSLMEELRGANLGYPVSWKESQQLPYLDACIKESLRMFPAVGFGLERIVPKDGLVMPDGYTLPGGTIVSMNPWVVSRDRSVYGADADIFNPSRWLQAKGESIDSFELRLSAMKRSELAFGWGKRICLGRNISYLEIYKAVPTLLLEYDIELVSDDPWITRNRWFVRQSNMDCWIKRRSK